MNSFTWKVTGVINGMLVAAVTVEAHVTVVRTALGHT
jgi:hypothetical protein